MMPFPVARIPSRFRIVPAAAIALALTHAPLVAEEKGAVSEQVDAVMAEAARLGLPVIAVASTDSCEEAPRLKRRLVGDVALQPLVARFALVELRMSGDDKWTWKRWQERFDSHRRQSPQVFVIRADGRKMFSGDPPADLAGFLRHQLGQGGQPLAQRQAELFASQLETAARLQAAGDLAGAVRAVMPAVRVPSFARSVVQSVAFRAAVAERMLARIEHAATEPGVGTDRLASVELLVAAAEEFATSLPEVARAARERTVEIGRDAEGRETVRQAQLLHRAAVTSRRSAERGLVLYEQIIELDPQSPAAELAAVRLRSLDACTP